MTFSAVFETPGPQAQKAFDSLTAEGVCVLDLARGHQLAVSRKGGAFQLDGWMRTAPIGVDVFNPAFDVTPAAFVTAIITEEGVAYPDFTKSIAALCEESGAIHESGA